MKKANNNEDKEHLIKSGSKPALSPTSTVILLLIEHVDMFNSHFSRVSVRLNPWPLGGVALFIDPHGWVKYFKLGD